jgi:O-antigen/teichoic acid export membrane protein
MNRNLKSYFKAITSGYARIVLTILVGLWMVPFTLRFLTRAEYGVFAIAGDILVWLGLLQLGTGASLNSRAAQLIGKRDTENLSELASTAFVIQASAAMLTVIAGGVVSLTVDSWFQVDSSIDGLKLVIFILILGASIRISAQVFNGLLVANKQIHINNYLGIGLFLFRTVLTVLFLFAGLRLFSLALSSLISTVVVSLIAFWRVRKNLPEIKLSLKKFRKEHVKDLLGNGIWFTIGGLAGILIVNLDRFMVGRFVSLEAVAAFIITGKLYFIAERVHGQVFNVMRPYFGQLHGQSKAEKLSELYHAAFSGSLLLSVLMASTIYLLNRWFISLWVGPEFYIGNTVSFLFALNFVLQSSVLPNRILLASTLFKMPQQNIARVSEGFLNLFFTILFARKWGLAGVLLGSVVATFLCSTVFMNVIARSFFYKMPSKGRSLLAYFTIVCLFLMLLGNRFAYIGYLVSVSFYIIITWLLLGDVGKKYYERFKSAGFAFYGRKSNAPMKVG